MSLRRAALFVLIAATAIFFATQFSNGVASINSDALPGLGRLVAVVALLLAGQIFVGEALVAIAPTPTTAAQARVAIHITQPAKYVPVGIAQAVGLTLVLSRFGARRGHAAASWVIHTGTVVAGGVMAGSIVAVARGWPVWILPVAFLVPFTVWRPALAAILTRVGRVVPFVSKFGELPSQGALLGCLAANAVGISLHGAAFALLVTPVGASTAAAISAYALAHGLATATPLPGGLGVREALLFGLLDAADGSAFTSIVLIRLLLMSVEAVLWLVAAVARRTWVDSET